MRNWLKLFFYLFCSFALFTSGNAQATKVRYKVVNGDTLYFVDLPVCVVDKINVNHVLKTKKDFKRYNSLTFHVKKVYPYARLAAKKLKEYEHELLAAKDDNERRKIMKKVEKAIKDKYGDELKKLTVTQGKILLKLIDRETGHTSYELVKEMRGSFAAGMWQGLAVLFGHNLKDDYDPLNDDWMIEEIIRKIELGIL